MIIKRDKIERLMMSMGYSISFVKNSKKTSISHNNRELTNDQKKNDWHKHINFEKSNENIYLEQTKIQDKFDELFNDSVLRFNAKQKRADRRIEDYYSKVLKDKKIEPQREFIIQVGDIDDFRTKKDDGSPTGIDENEVEKNKKIANKILKKYFEDFHERNPNLHIYNAVIHNDEASPHLHLNIIPTAHGYKRGMDTQCSFDKALKEQGLNFDKNDSRSLWNNFRKQEVDSVEHLMHDFGWERKEVGTHDFKDIHEYKMQKEFERFEALNNKLEMQIDVEKGLDLKIDQEVDLACQNECLNRTVFKLARHPDFSSENQSLSDTFEEMAKNSVSDYSKYVDGEKIYNVCPRACEQEADDFKNITDWDYRKTLKPKEYKKALGNLAVCQRVNTIYHALEDMPKNVYNGVRALEDSAEMKRARLDYKRLEREIERSNEQSMQNYQQNNSRFEIDF